jgi:DNA polymerase-1
MTRTLLIDADIVAYKYSSANEKAWYFDGPQASPLRSADLGAAIDCARDFIADLRGKLGASDVIVCLSDPKNNFRKSIYPQYKSNRIGVRKPEYLMAVKDWLAENFQTYLRPGLEADDCMGILATHPSLIKGEKIMVSEDKDMKTIPGLLYNPREGSKAKVRTITRRDACRAHFIQTIVGDTSDGYPGAPGIGPKSEFVQQIQAAREPSAEWPTVIAAFVRSCQLKGPTDAFIAGSDFIPKMALTQARLARILRTCDWNFKEKKPILWTPSTGSQWYTGSRNSV